MGLYDRYCTDLYRFVCYSASRKKKQILRLEVKSDQNVNDPGEMTEILEKMKQILKMKGLDENATMSWKIQSDGNVFQKYQERNVTKEPCH
ncbi:uncharacterized protein [Paramisgurnus dabryanus]|uniref:uncharacterized protein n=1 Tax=Paramisgurnus dabryanus TaxID=90735 RepID=UPI0031F460C3